MGIIKKVLVILIVLLLVLLIWGFIGGSQAKDIGITCDSGVGDGETLCWNWHQNVVGDIQEAFTGTANVIKDSINKLN